MSIEEKIKKVEALLNGTTSEGERQAAELAIRRLLESAELKPIEFTVRLDGRWKKKLFVAVCGKHHLRTYRYARQRHTTVMVNVNKSFMNEVLWPEYKKYALMFEELAKEIMDELIEKIYKTDEEEIVISGELPLTETVL